MSNKQKRNKIAQKPNNNQKTSPQIKTNDLFADEKRTTYEIYAKMLQICQQPQNKTKIMYKTNTSYISFKKYLTQLQNLKLLQENERKYKITQRGILFLEKYIELQQFLNEKDT
jgi:predicted transcriptional regulator